MLVIIDNYDSFTYNLVQLAAGIYPNVKVIRNDLASVEEIARLRPAGIILSPGPGRPEKAGICIEAILRFASEVPILGVCLGHQAIATAFGGEVVPADEVCHGKRSSIFHRNRGLFAGLPHPFTAGRYHSLAARKETLPSVLEVEAETEQGMVMALKHRRYPCYGLQFHPESILTPCGPQILKAFIDREVLSC